MADGGIQGSGTCCQSWELTLCIFVRLNISRHTSFLRDHTDPLTFGKQVKQALTHRLALGAFRPDEADDDAWVVLSQCTFWCWVLSDEHRGSPSSSRRRGVSMHLLVLGAFRPRQGELMVRGPMVSMHLLVLGAFRRKRRLLVA